MGARGPKPGYKRKTDAADEVASVEAPRLSAHERENPQKLSGDALRELAHRNGLSRTECARLSDEKIREQLRYITYRQYEMG